MTAAPERTTFRPRAGQAYVRFLRPAERSAGGIWLPESAQENSQEVEVLDVGPGRCFAETGRTALVHVRPGDVCLILFRDFKRIPGPLDEGVVDVEDLIAVVDPETGTPEPLGEWVRLGLPRTEERTAGGLLLPEEVRRRPRCGRVEAMGAGQLVCQGIFAGLRQGCYNLAGLPRDFRLIGATAYWDTSGSHAAEALDVGREWTQWSMVRASELVAISEEH